MTRERRPTLKLSIIGDPVSQSRSPEIHQQFAEQFDIPIFYEKIQSNTHNFRSTSEKLMQRGDTGANVTAPCKKIAWTLSDIKDCSTQTSQTANTLLFRNGKVTAYNTDGRGLLNDFNKKNIALNNKTILILGSGAVVAGVLPSLLEETPKHITIASRRSDSAENIIQRIKAQTAVAPSELNRIIDLNYDLVIHATTIREIPTWTSDIEPHLSALKYLDRDTLYYDLNYAATDTPFLRWAKRKNAHSYFDGKGMLIEQAALSFEIWTGLYPETHLQLSGPQPAV